MKANGHWCIIKWLAVVGLVAAWSPPAAADDLALWTFEVSYPGLSGTGSNSPPALAEEGVYAAMSVASGWHANPATVWSSPVGNGSPHAFSSNTWSVEDYWQFRTSSLGYHGLAISWHQTRSNTGPGQFRLECSAEGMMWLPIIEYTVSAITWSSIGSPKPESIFGPYPLPPLLDDRPTIFVRLVSLVGAAAAGTNRIDNVLITGQPPMQPGACCMGWEEVCNPGVFELDCQTMGGVWQGPGTDCFPNPCRRIDYYWDITTGEKGGNGWNGEWIYYPNSPSGPWWNMWWPNEFALDRQKQVTVTFDVNFPTGGGFLEVALNWSTPAWTNTNRPPLADEEQYIARAVLGTITTPGTRTFTFMVPFCPRWVSMDIRGYAYVIEGTIDHFCLPPQLGACCQPGGGCAMTTQANCLPPGVWHPEWQSCDPNPCPWDLVVCEPQGGTANNPFHPPTYWYDVTPYGFGRCDFHVRVYDSNPANYTNVSLPAATWIFVVHEVNPGEWWASWYDPGCVNAVFNTFRFQFDNPNPSVWSDWTTTISGTNDPYNQLIDQSQNHSDQPDGYGYRVHAPRPRALEPKWHQGPHPPLEGFDAASDYWWQGDGSVSKWEQPPDPMNAGYHAHDWWDNGVRRLVLADDWLCEGGLVTDLHWWGTIEAPGSGLAGFRLSIHDNSMAACVPAEPPAWLRNVPISQITVTSTGLFNVLGQEIFLYEYNLPRSEWFAQVAGQTYWFDVSAISNDPHAPCQWIWQRAASMPPRLCPPMYKDIPPFPTWVAFGPDVNFAFRITSQPGPGVEVNKVVADDFISDGRPIRAVGWVGSYFDERYEPIHPPMPPYVLDGWLLSFHHTLPDAVCPPDILTGVGPTVLGVYFAPAEAVRITPLGDYLDCFQHRVYGYEVDLSQCCLICAVPDPRLPDLPPPARPGAFHEVSGFGYWLDIQAVVGARWMPMLTEQCELVLTGHLPSPETPDGHFWGWHTSPEVRLEEACTGRIADRTPYPPDCWDYGDWVKQPWLCPTMPPVPPVNMAFTLLAPPCLAGDVNWDGVVDVNDIGCFVNCLLYGAMPGCVCPCAEMNGDGVVDGLDIQGFVDALLSP